MLEAVLPTDSVANLAEGLREHYAPYEGDDPALKGHSILKVNSHSSGFGLENVLALKNSLLNAKSERTAAKELLAKFGDLTPDQAVALAGQVEELKTKLEKGTDKDKVQAAVNQATQELRSTFENEKKSLTETLASRERAVGDLLVESVAASALAKLGGNPTFLMHHIKSQTKVEWEDGKPVAHVIDPNTGTVRPSLQSGNHGPMGVAELVETMSTQDEFKGAFAGSQASGSGANNSQGSGSGTSNSDAAMADMSPEQRLVNYHRNKA